MSSWVLAGSYLVAAKQHLLVYHRLGLLLPLSRTLWVLPEERIWLRVVGACWKTHPTPETFFCNPITGAHDFYEAIGLNTLEESETVPPLLEARRLRSIPTLVIQDNVIVFLHCNIVNIYVMPRSHNRSPSLPSRTLRQGWSFILL